MRPEARAASRGCTRGTIAVHRWHAAERARYCRHPGAGQRGEAAHGKHGGHVRDAGDVPAQWLVELERALSRVASRAQGAGRAAGQEAGGGAAERGVHAACTGGERATAGWGWHVAGRVGERTSNMLLMSVTREVSQLSGWLNLNARCRGSRAARARGAGRAACWTGGRREAASECAVRTRSVQGRGCDCRQVHGGRGAGSSAHTSNM